MFVLYKIVRQIIRTQVIQIQPKSFSQANEFQKNVKFTLCLEILFHL